MKRERGGLQANEGGGVSTWHNVDSVVAASSCWEEKRKKTKGVQ